MAFIPVPNVARVEMVFTQDGQVVENVYNVEGDTPMDATALATIAVLFKNWWVAQCKALAPTNVNLVKVIASALDSENSPSVEVTDGLPSAGTAAQAAMPNSITVAIKWQTGLRGRSFRGRTYYIGLNEANVTGNEVGAGTITALTAAFNNLRTTLDATPYDLVVVSRFSNNQPRTTGLTTPISGLSIDRFLDSQRRRLPNRGA